jgi:hypothetical protein
MKKALLVCVVLFVSTMAYSQEEVNALYPSELLIESFCPVDTGFTAQFEDKLWGNIYFSLEDHTAGKLPYIFTEMATNPDFKTYNIESITDFYPYDIETYEKSDEGSLFKAFGGDTVIVLGDGEEEVKMVSMIDTLEMMAVSFVEEWQLDTVKPAFSKKVKAIIPIRCYNDAATERDILRRTCIISQNKQAKKSDDLMLIARVKYEALLFPQGEESHGFLASEELFGREIYGSPFFSSYSRNMLVRFLESSALRKRVKCYDFSTGNAVIDTDAIMHGFGYSNNVITIELGGGEVRDTTILEKTRNINSVIFFEEWYVDRKTGQLTKNVTAIAPVLWDSGDKGKSAELFVRFDKD